MAIIETLVAAALVDAVKKLSRPEKRALSRAVKDAVKESLNESVLPDASPGKGRLRRVKRRLRLCWVRRRLRKAAKRQHHQLVLALLKLPTEMEGEGLRTVLEECLRDAKVDAGLLAGAVDATQYASKLHEKLDGFVSREATEADSTLRAFYEVVASERKRWTERPELWPEQLLRFEVERLLAAIVRHAGSFRHFRDLPALDVLQVSRSVSVVPRCTAPEGDEDPNLGAAQHYREHGPGGTSEAQVVDWVGFADQNARVMVLADPGMGKSWLVYSETRRRAGDAVKALRTGVRVEDVVIPAGMRCDELLEAADVVQAAGGGGLDAAVARVLWKGHQNEARFLEGWLARRAARGGAAVLLDGWDELAEQRRARLADLVDAWAGEPVEGTKASLLITSRIAGYGGPPGERTRLSEVVLTTFNRDDIDVVIDGCGLPERALRRLRDGLENPTIAEMARIPQLLALLCVLAREDQSLPHAQHELYGQVLRKFLRHDRTGKTGETDAIDEALVFGVLGTVAYEMATTGGFDAIDEHVLGRAIDKTPHNRDLARTSHEVRKRLTDKVGLLTPVERYRDGDERQYRFLHNTFAEYLVAHYLSRQPAAEWWDVIRDRIFFEPTWEQVVPMLGGLLHDADAPAEPVELIERLLGRDDDPFHLGLRMAARTVAELTEDRPGVDVQTGVIVDRATRLLRTSARADGVAVLTSLGRHLADRSGGLPDLLNDAAPEVRCAATRALTGVVTRAAKARDAVVVLLTDADTNVVRVAAECLGHAAGDRQVRAEFLRALKGEDRYLRRIARRSLADSAATDPNAREVLIELLGDPEPSLRRVAARSLVSAVNAHDAGNVRQALIEVLDRDDEQDDEQAEVRQAAVLTLGRAVTKHAKVRVALLALLRDAEGDRDTRLYAVGSLATVVVDVPEVQDALCAALNDTSSREARGAAARALRSVATDSMVSDALINALTNGNSELKSAAAEVLRDVASAPSVHIKLVELLDRARTPGAGVRRAAALALRGAALAQDALLNAVRDDKDVRTAAAASLAVTPEMSQETRYTLLEILGDTNEDPYLRLAILSGLARESGQEDEVREAFLRLLTDQRQEPYVRVPAAEVLQAAVRTDYRVREAFVRLLEGDAQDTYLTLSVVRGLESAVDTHDRVADALAATLRDRQQDPNVREAAAAGLGPAHADLGVRAALVESLNEESAEVRRASAAALKGAAAEPEVWRSLLTVLRQSSRNSTVREAATASLTAAVADVPDVRSELLDLFQSENRNLRLSAIEALGVAATKDAQVQDALFAALADPDPLIRNTALRRTAKGPILMAFVTHVLDQWERFDIDDGFYVFLRHCVLTALRATPDGLRRDTGQKLLRDLGTMTKRFAHAG